MKRSLLLLRGSSLTVKQLSIYEISLARSTRACYTFPFFFVVCGHTESGGDEAAIDVPLSNYRLVV